MIDNSGPPGSATRKDVGFLHEHRYTTYYGGDEARPETASARSAGDPGNEGAGGTRHVGSPPEGSRRDRERATKRLTEEGRAVLERYRRQGDLTEEEVNAFLR